MRFSGRSEVRALARRGRRFETELGKIVWGRTSSPAAARLLFIISTRVAKRSTERNRIRRQLGESFRREWAAVPFPAAVMVYVHPAVVAMPGSQRRALAAALAQRLRRVCLSSV